jgi:hypothetical protein
MPRLLAEYGSEAFKQIPGVMRPWRSFGVILDGEDGQLAVAQALNGAVVEIEMCHLDLSWQAIGIDRETVILRSDFDPVRRQMHDRLITTAMSELELVGLSPQR